MTKKDINEEALYQQFLGELAEGEQEYDRLMAAGEAPAQQKAATAKPRIVALRRYFVAASVALLMVVGANALLHFMATPDCVAYVGGEKVTDKTAIEQLINANVEDMRTDNLAEAQLMDMLMEL